MPVKGPALPDGAGAGWLGISGAPLLIVWITLLIDEQASILDCWASSRCSMADDCDDPAIFSAFDVTGKSLNEHKPPERINRGRAVIGMKSRDNRA